MILTVQNQLATPLEIGFPINRTLTENGGSADTFVGGVSLEDLKFGEDRGDSAHKRLNLLKQEGKITMSIAVDPDDGSVDGGSMILDEANEL